MPDTNNLKDELLQIFKDIRDSLYKELQNGGFSHSTQDPTLHKHAREMSAQLARDARLYGFSKTELEERKKLVTAIFRAEASIFDLKKKLKEDITDKEKNLLEFQLEAQETALRAARESLKLNNKTFEVRTKTVEVEKLYLDLMQKALFFEQEALKAGKSGDAFRKSAALQAADALKMQANAALNLSKTVQAQQQKMLIQKKAAALFGLSPDAVENMQLSISMIAKSGLLAFLTLAETLIHVISYLNELRLSAGLAASQMGQLVGLSFKGGFAGLGSGVIAAPGTIAKDVGALVREYGSLDNVTSDVISSQLKLTQVYGLSQPQAAHLGRLIDYMSDRTAGAASHVISFARALGTANNIPVTQMVEDLANNTEIFARYGERGAQSFIKAGAAARQMGITLGQLDTLQNNLLANPEQFLVGLQQLRQFGINLNNPAELLRLANTPGASQQFAQALQRQLGGIRFENLSRIQQNMLSQTLGLDPETIQRLTGSFRTGIRGQLKQPTGEAYSGEGFDNLLSSMGSLTDAIKQATSSLKNIGMLVLGLLGTVGLVSRVGGLLGGIGRFFVGAGAAGTAAGVGEGATIGGGLLSGLAGKIIPGLGVGLMAGSQVLDIAKGQSIGQVLKSHMFQDIGMALGGIVGGIAGGGVGALPGIAIGGALGTLADSLIGHGTSASSQAMSAPTDNVQLSINTKPLEEKLDNLMDMFKNGSIRVEIDGRKVGSMIAASFPRHA